MHFYILFAPGDGFNYHVKRYTSKNKESEINNDEIPHEMMCVICLENKITHDLEKFLIFPVIS